jgi:hypothetical protein
MSLHDRIPVYQPDMVVFHVPFDTLAAVIYGTELVMWIGIMICGVVLGRGEKEDHTTGQENEEHELPQVTSPARVSSRASGHSGEPSHIRPA